MAYQPPPYSPDKQGYYPSEGQVNAGYYGNPAGSPPPPNTVAYNNAPPMQHHAQQHHHVSNNTVIIGQPAATPVIVQQQAVPPSYLAMSIITCLCCNWISGIVAIIMSCASNTSASSGDMESARRQGKWALYINIFSVLTGITWIVVVIAMSATSSSSSCNSYYDDCYK